MNYQRGYHRISDDSVSSTGFGTYREAVNDAKAAWASEDIDSAWVRDSTGEVVFRVRDPKVEGTPRTCGHPGFIEDGRCEMGHGA